MKNVIVRFREYEPHASSAERGIVQLVLKAPEKILEYNSHQLAEAAFSSPATVVRLCKKIGFSGYKAMQQRSRSRRTSSGTTVWSRSLPR